MKTLYNNPFASQLLAASSKMFSSFDVNPFLQTTFKQVAHDATGDTFDGKYGKNETGDNFDGKYGKNETGDNFYGKYGENYGSGD